MGVIITEMTNMHVTPAEGGMTAEEKKVLAELVDAVNLLANTDITEEEIPSA